MQAEYIHINRRRKQRGVYCQNRRAVFSAQQTNIALAVPGSWIDLNLAVRRAGDGCGRAAAGLGAAGAAGAHEHCNSSGQEEGMAGGNGCWNKAAWYRGVWQRRAGHCQPTNSRQEERGALPKPRHHSCHHHQSTRTSVAIAGHAAIRVWRAPQGQQLHSGQLAVALQAGLA